MKIDEIKEIVQAVSKTRFHYVNINHEGTQITLSDEVPFQTIATTSTAVTQSQPTIKLDKKFDVEADIEAGIEADIKTKEMKPNVKEKSNEEVFLVKSPLVGTFYEASSPEAEPFVKMGDRVKKGDILCIIEAMKLMNDIKAEVSGEIVEIVAENETGVEYGQVLFKIAEK